MRGVRPVIVGVAAAAILASALLYFVGGRAAQTELSTARAVPADAAIYFGFNADLDSDAWSRAFGLLRTLGMADPLAKLREAAAEQELDWEEDIRPFLGHDVSIWVRDLSAPVPEAGVVFRCQDLDRCRRALRDELRASREGEIEGLRYWTAEDGGVAVAELGDLLVLANKETALTAMRDAYENRAQSLAEAEEFAKLRDELTPEFLCFAFVRPDALLSAFGDQGLEREFEELEASLRPVAATVNAGEQGFVAQAASLAEPGETEALLQEHDWQLLRRVPGDAIVALALYGIDDIWESVRDAVEEAAEEVQGELDGLAREGGFDELGDAAGDLDVGPLGDLLGLLEGETVLAFWREGERTAGLMVAQVADEAARDALERLFASEASEERRVGGVDVRFLLEEEIGYAVHDGLLWVGNELGLERALSGPSPSLAEARRFQAAADLLPAGLGPFLFVDVAGLVEWADGTIDLEELGLERLPAAFIFTALEERGVVRATGALLVEE